jgi:hypothetical protein
MLTKLKNVKSHETLILKYAVKIIFLQKSKASFQKWTFINVHF